MDISTLSIAETKDFVAKTLDLPDLAEQLEKQEVDGSTLLDCTTSLIREFIPSITIGKCHKLFKRLKEYQQKNSEDWRSPSEPTPPSSAPEYLDAPETDVASPETDVASPETDVASPEADVASPETDVASPEADVASPEADVASPEADVASPETVHVRSNPVMQRKSTIPVPMNFPIEKLVIAPEGMLMINTGNVTIMGKAAITTAVVSQMLTYSPSQCYVSFELKRMAATALVRTYPTLEMGLGTKAAVDAWHAALGTKLSNWRKRGKVMEDQTMGTMKAKYKKQASSGREASSTVGRKRRNSEFGDLTDEEIADQEERKRVIHLEFSKPVRTRNVRLLQVETEKIFPLRRKQILSGFPHAQELLREWPSLKVEMIMLKELCLVLPSANGYAEFCAKLRSNIPKLMEVIRGKCAGYPRSHPMSGILDSIPLLDESDPEFDTDLNTIASVAGLSYILPTTTKKSTHAHRHLVDVCGPQTTTDDIREAVEDRSHPFVQIFGCLTDRQKVLVFADKTSVCQCSSAMKALYIMMSLYFILDIQYASSVAPTLEFLQILTLGIPLRKPQTKVRDLLRSFKL